MTRANANDFVDPSCSLELNWLKPMMVLICRSSQMSWWELKKLKGNAGHDLLVYKLEADGK